MRDLIRAGTLDGFGVSWRELLWALGELRYEEEALLEQPLTDAELGQRASREVVRVAGLAIVRQAPPTAHGHVFISLEDETGLMNLIVRPDLYAAERRVLREASVLVAEGTLQRDSRAASVLVQQVWAPDGGWQDK